MRKLLSICATAVLLSALSFAQGSARPQANDNQTQYEEAPRHDYGWIGLLGLLGLGGLIRRRESSNITEPRSIDTRRAA
jgi:MYXO-CTERM domain-containing protein